MKKTGISLVILAALLVGNTGVSTQAAINLIIPPDQNIKVFIPLLSIVPAFSEMVLVPAGAFQRGCDPAHNGGLDCLSDELPLRSIYLDTYLIDKNLVTNAQYEQCVKVGECAAPTRTSSFTHPIYYNNPVFSNYLVINVSWYDATNYCNWTGKRLPTEAEWEKTARGSSDVRAFPWGDNLATCILANYSLFNIIFDFCVGDTSPVGSYLAGASPYGVLDMAGNGLEWVNDWWQSDYYSGAPTSNPPGPAAGSLKVLRGGSWEEEIENLLVAHRDNLNNPAYHGLDTSFRCAATPGN